MIVKSGALADRAVVLDLKDYERALVWIDGRFSHVLPPGLYAYWTGVKDVRVEVVDARKVRFEHPDFKVIVRRRRRGAGARHWHGRAQQRRRVVHRRRLRRDAAAGRLRLLEERGGVKVVEVDLREQMFDVAGQDIMTADKVTLRMNAVVTYRVVDARQAVTVSDDARQALYREAQLALRAVVGARELDTFLTDKDAVANELAEAVRRRAGELGLEVVSVGIRDIILPGEMKDLMNKVTEAKKAAEANLIVRREETAAMRSQANTAKLLADNPTLMRLRELEVLEKVATSGKLNVVLGEKGLADRVVNLL